MGPVHADQVARPAPGTTALRHGEAEPLGQTFAGLEPGAYCYRFGETEHPLDEATVDALADLMRTRRDSSAGTPYIPAGYTYLGQFIDHDITFDATSHRALVAHPKGVENFRTPRLDLDSLYGSGPVVHPFLYDWEHPDAPGACLLVGRNPDGGHEDVPRNRPGRALLGDARNDENAILVQLHLLFINFHNAVVASLPSANGHWEQLFEDARRTVRWHYQWLVVHDFLPTILGPELAAERIAAGPPADCDACVPVEFSTSAFRFGHSIIRSQYVLTRSTTSPPPPLRIFPDLDGLRPLPAELVLDWTRFFKFPGLGHQYQPQNGMEIDSSLSGPLFALPGGGGSLAQRNLRRAAKLGVKTGQEVAEALELPKLDEGALRLGELPEGPRKRLRDATPLWYYILCEAESIGGDHLGPVGGRIVADVILCLLHSDPTSYVHEDGWHPTLGANAPNDFRMTDLIEFVS